MFELSRHSLSRCARRVRWGILGLCWAPLVGSFFYNQGYKVPFLGCPFRHLTGIPCPTCGMTRSFMAIARGNLSEAVSQHLFGPIVFAGLLIAVAHIGVELLTGRQVSVFYSRFFQQRKLQLFFLVMFFSYYGLRLFSLSKSGELIGNLV